MGTLKVFASVPICNFTGQSLTRHDNDANTLVLESILPNFFLCKHKIFPFFALPFYRNFFICYKHSSLTAKIGKQ